MKVDLILHKEYVEAMQERLAWCIQTERYEMAARYRDNIKYHTTEDQKYREEYEKKLMQKYTPEDILDGMKNPTPEKIRRLKDKYLYNKDGQ